MQPTHDIYNTDEKRWQAIVQRERAADECFFYGVITTGVFCYPSCPSRAALRSNTRFYANRRDALADGMRPCKRCRPDEPPLVERQRLLVERACRMISEAAEPVKVDALAEQVGISRFHLQKLFQQFLGIGPKQYIKAVRARQLSKALDGRRSVTEALFAAGYDSSSAYYADGATRIGMNARTYRRHGEGMRIRYAFGNSLFGKVVVAATERGVCGILFGDTQRDLVADLRDRFSKATISQATQAMAQLVADVLAGIEHPELAARLPLDIQGTAFQEKVWAALRDIAPGDTATYSDIATRIGKPTAARAVATACASNPIAVIVPCHRVVRASGDISGYRWGVDRKRRLLAYEVQTDTENED